MKTESIHTVDGFTLSAVSHRATASDVVVWLHGITVDKDEYLDFFRDGATWLQEEGISSLRFDFRGHGSSSGSSMDFSIVGQNYDVRAAIEAVQQWSQSPIRMHLVGASFGAPPALFGALKFASSVASVFLISPVLSYEKTFFEPSTEWAAEVFSREKRNELDRTGKLYMDPEFCIGHRLLGEMEVIQPDRVLELVRQPVTVVHGDKDSMVPYHVSQQICTAIPNIRFLTLPGADHGYMKAGDDEGHLDESIANRQKVFQLIKEQVRQ